MRASRASREISSAAFGELPETPKAGDPLFRRVRNVLVGNNRLALDAAARRARELGFRTLVLASEIQGETRDVARMHAANAREIVWSASRPVTAPACLHRHRRRDDSDAGWRWTRRAQSGIVLAVAARIAGLPDVVVSAREPMVATARQTAR